MEETVAALLQLYPNGAVPLAALATTVPLLRPQSVCVGVTITVGNGVVVTVAESVNEQLLASVTVTLYVPPTALLRFCVVAPLFHVYAYGNVPPLMDTFTAPLAAWHVALTGAALAV